MFPFNLLDIILKNPNLFYEINIIHKQNSDKNMPRKGSYEWLPGHCRGRSVEYNLTVGYLKRITPLLSGICSWRARTVQLKKNQLIWEIILAELRMKLYFSGDIKALEKRNTCSWTKKKSSQTRNKGKLLQHNKVHFTKIPQQI